MKRDFICILRLIVDSLPRFIRDSYLLFLVARFIFRLPDSLYEFRKKYTNGEYVNLSIFYEQGSPYALKRISSETDINSIHLKRIVNLIEKEKPKSIIDVGCGSGYLIKIINKKFPDVKLSVIDFNVPKNIKVRTNIEFVEGDIIENLSNIKQDKYEFVICSHVLEHIPKPEKLLLELRRISKSSLIVVCPLEKKLKWGMNYHINFFQNKTIFLKFITNISYLQKTKIITSEIIQSLGDIFYHEKFL